MDHLGNRKGVMSDRSSMGMKGAILMIHGGCCTGAVWNCMATSFRDMGWRVEAPTLFPQLRATSGPSADLPKLSLADYVAEWEATAHRLEAETGRLPIVFGHSMGGLIAQKLAELGVARAVVLLASSPPANMKVAPTLSSLVTFANLMFAPNFASKAIKIWETGIKWGMLNCVPRSRRAEICATMCYESGRAFYDGAVQEKASIDPARVTVPILTVCAARDRVMSVATQRQIAARYQRADSDYLEYPDHAHWIVDEPGTEQVIADIAKWLNAKIVAEVS
jgi:pimeloyl-ACP methyl ester carboxylesterase